LKRPAVFSGLWRSEKGLSAMLVFLALSLFVGASLVGVRGVGLRLFDLFFSLLLLSGVMMASRRKALTVVVATLVVLAIVARWVSFTTPGAGILLKEVLSFVSLSLLAALVIEQVFRPGPVTGYRIQGAIVVYLLLGLIFAQVYKAILIVLPGSFASAGLELATEHGLLYFSFVTLTTVGYGDITPIHPIARSLAVGEALVGQLYPAILIARLVSLQIIARAEGMD
jgi:hypothetical protein